MIGAIILAIVVLILIPIGFLVSTTAAAGVFGFLLKDNSDRAHAGSELLELSD